MNTKSGCCGGMGRPRNRGRNGIALVIVLSFVALLTVVVLAFFSRVTTESTTAGSSSQLVKADLLAKSGLEIVVTDLKQEIVTGSNAVADSGGKLLYYVPKTPFNAVPARSGNPAANPDGTDPVPNLIRRSYADDTSLPYSSKASPLSSATASGNGRSVSPQRWNAGYLLPWASSSGDNTPVASFTSPDWVFVDREGPVKLASMGAALASPSGTNKKFVVGRYAYAVYDEGGLLDMNVAGYPTATSDDQAAEGKRVPAYADLRQLPPLASLPSATKDKIVNGLVGWRNFASAAPGGNFPDFIFDVNAVKRYFDHVTGNKDGFRSVFSGGSSGPTDQALLTRQQLIQLVRSLGANPEVLQYMGTFSRDIDQPSYVPSPSRPKVQAKLVDDNNLIGTGNDAHNRDRESDPALDMNPPLLSVRVAGTFRRIDGSTAVKGEPLLKKRFPLSRLALLLRSSTENKGNPADNSIYKNFGLYRNDDTKPWQYDHGTANKIKRLSEVVAEGREPDFFELLKAAIDVGSLGKQTLRRYTFQFTSNATAGPIQNGLDGSVDLQILRIGANIIDQYDADGYPTGIVFSGDYGSANQNQLTARGIENLPYMYGFRDRPVWATLLTGKFMMHPLLWNPHASNSSNPADSPTSFRIRVELVDPAMVPALGVVYRDDPKTEVPYPADPTTIDDYSDRDMAVSMTFNAGDANGYNGFREPTLLTEKDKPDKTNLDGSRSKEATDNYTVAIPPPNPANKTLVGLLMCDFPWENPSPKDPAASPKTWQPNKLDWSSAPFWIFLEYQMGSGWIIYDQQIFSHHTQLSIGIAHRSSDYKKAGPPVWALDDPRNSGYHVFLRADPRSSRWGLWNGQYYGEWLTNPSGPNSPGPAWPIGDMTYPTVRPDGWLSYGLTNDDAIHDGAFATYAAFKMKPSEKGGGYSGSTGANVQHNHYGAQIGFSSENTTRDGMNPYGIPNPKRYNRDPDGVVRRAMGGYASDTRSGGGSGYTRVEGLPLAMGNNASRPILLNRPFRSVAELGYAFRDTPWSNLNFSFPESGDKGLLDVFCINENTASDAVVAGRVNLNTRQAPVLQALLAGAKVDELGVGAPSRFSTTQVSELAAALVSRTSDTSGTKGPLANRAEVVGRSTFAGTTPYNWPSPTFPPASNDPIDPEKFYTGFSQDIGTVPSMSSVPSTSLITRKRDAAIRALADVGNTRVWNLLIDLVAQSGRIPVTAKGLDDFVVEGEKRYWLHVAIDRYTGKVIDQQLESVNE